jgi:hypothetical protein
MKYPDGQDISVGDRVKLSSGQMGTVVCSIDSGEFTKAFPKSDWEHLKSGIIIEADNGEVFHYAEADEDLELVSGAARQSRTN